MLCLTAAWAQRARQPLHVFTVNHGVRAAAAAEADYVAALAHELAVPCTRITLGASDWGDGTSVTPPAAPDQQRLRLARHRALAHACANQGVRLLFLGHNADDRAETLAMRLMRPGVGARGLSGFAGLSPAPVWPQGRDLALGRPLLEVSRADLRVLLRQSGFSWCEDPSNADRRHERVRVRGVLGAMRHAGLSPERWRALARAAAAVEAQTLEAAWALRCAAVDARATLAGAPADVSQALSPQAERPPGGLTLHVRSYVLATPTVRQRCLEAVLHAASGTVAPIAPAALARLDAALGALDAPFRGATLAGARLRPLGRECVVAERDPGALFGRAGGAPIAPLRLAAGTGAVWDGRWLVGPHASAVEVRPGVDGAPEFPDHSGAAACYPPRRLLAPQILARALRPYEPDTWRVHACDV